MRTCLLADARQEAVTQWRRDHGFVVADEDAFGAVPAAADGEPGLRRPTRWEVQKSVAAHQAAKASTPATKEDLGKVEATISHLKALIHAATGRTVL